MRLGKRGTRITSPLPPAATGGGDGREVGLPSLAGIVYGITSNDSYRYQDSSTSLQTTAAITPPHSSNGHASTSSYSGIVQERHRHRYEVNPEYVTRLEDHGLYFTGRDADTGVRMEICELSRAVHPFYFGVQFHPEVKSRPTRPSPPFYAFTAACAKKYEAMDVAGQLWQRQEEEIRQEIVKIVASQTSQASQATPPPASASKKRSSGEAFSFLQVAAATTPTHGHPLGTTMGGGAASSSTLLTSPLLNTPKQRPRGNSVSSAGGGGGGGMGGPGSAGKM